MMLRNATRLVRQSLAGRALLVLFALAGCGELEGEPVRIGVLTSLTGPGHAVSGAATVDAARMAADEINQAGGLRVGRRRHPIALELADAGASVDAAVASARSLITQRGVVAIIGPQFSIQAIPVALIAEASQVPMISPMSTMRETTEGKRFVFRVAYGDDFQGRVLAGVAFDDLKARRAAMLYDPSNRYSADVALGFRREFEARGGSLVEVASYTDDAKDRIAPGLASIRKARPDVLLLPNNAYDVVEQLQGLATARFAGTVLGGDSWDNALLQDLDAAQGAVVVHQWHPDVENGGAPSFVPGYTARYGHAPSVTAATTFDAVALIVNAMQRSGSLDPLVIRDSLAAMRDFQGVTGGISYAHGGDPVKSAVVLRVERGAMRGKLQRVVKP